MKTFRKRLYAKAMNVNFLYMGKNEEGYKAYGLFNALYDRNEYGETYIVSDYVHSHRVMDNDLIKYRINEVAKKTENRWKHTSS